MYKSKLRVLKKHMREMNKVKVVKREEGSPDFKSAKTDRHSTWRKEQMDKRISSAIIIQRCFRKWKLKVSEYKKQHDMIDDEILKVIVSRVRDVKKITTMEALSSLNETVDYNIFKPFHQRLYEK